MEKLLRLLEGYVIVELEGLGLEGFVSAAAVRGIVSLGHLNSLVTLPEY